MVSDHIQKNGGILLWLMSPIQTHILIFNKKKKLVFLFFCKVDWDIQVNSAFICYAFPIENDFFIIVNQLSNKPLIYLRSKIAIE